MTDYKGAGEEEYTHNDVSCSVVVCEICGYNRGYADGRKAERERCARIAASWLNPEVGELIAERIRGGQDAK